MNKLCTIAQKEKSKGFKDEITQQKIAAIKQRYHRTS